jgi:hypothetical protein
VGLKEEVISILRGSLPRSINFNFPAFKSPGKRIEVSGYTFIRVADAVESGELGVTQDQTLLPHDAGGCYIGINGTPFSNTLVLPENLSTPYAKIAVIHEAVHASFDLTFSMTTRFDNEVAAYVAGAWYSLLISFPLVNSPVFVTAQYSANICRNCRRYLINSDVSPLRESLSKDPLYSGYIKGLIDRGDGA